MATLAQREARRFHLFVSPWLLGFILFTAGPIIAAIVISFMEWNLLKAPQWVGLANYERMFGDPEFWESIENTVQYGVGYVALGVTFTFVMALLLNQPLRFQGLFRTVMYMPSVVSGLATALLWLNILHPDYGLINKVLATVGITGPGWLASQEWAIPALVLMAVWGAGNTIVIYLAGLQGIPKSLYEAAEIDGAGWWRRFWSVTVPMMSPVIFFNVVTGFIGALQGYVLILAMTEGGPGNATMVLGLYIYRHAFVYFDMGYAAALSWAMFAIIIAVTAIQFALARRWVHYEFK
ncbi:carbohydrate ABC transporter permease [Nonomuraea sp. NPDC059023]|uniref:Multiple sugar transport system permease protein n=1 Tax=Nonomuraea endophytica TaxID=714136 RepID=A0A7W8A014_9ACTN|nr:sugar ABC transporter permease [Nonomuraea endophytica]MBB5076996.1 multiple sugar transport system permease protein [Nonomuraea endophytica]